MKNSSKKLVEALLARANGDTKSADALLHEFVLARSRKIHESLVQTGDVNVDDIIAEAEDEDEFLNGTFELSVSDLMHEIGKRGNAELSSQIRLAGREISDELEYGEAVKQLLAEFPVGIEVMEVRMENDKLVFSAHFDTTEITEDGEIDFGDGGVEDGEGEESEADVFDEDGDFIAGEYDVEFETLQDYVADKIGEDEELLARADEIFAMDDLGAVVEALSVFLGEIVGSIELTEVTEDEDGEIYVRVVSTKGEDTEQESEFEAEVTEDEQVEEAKRFDDEDDDEHRDTKQNDTRNAWRKRREEKRSQLQEARSRKRSDDEDEDDAKAEKAKRNQRRQARDQKRVAEAAEATTKTVSYKAFVSAVSKLNDELGDEVELLVDDAMAKDWSDAMFKNKLNRLIASFDVKGVKVVSVDLGEIIDNGESAKSVEYTQEELKEGRLEVVQHPDGTTVITQDTPDAEPVVDPIVDPVADEFTDSADLVMDEIREEAKRILESYVSELEVVRADLTTDGVQQGGGRVKQNRKSAALANGGRDMDKAKPVVIKRGKEVVGYEKEKAPATKTWRVGKNQLEKGEFMPKPAKKETGALLNKPHGKENDVSLFSKPIKK